MERILPLTHSTLAKVPSAHGSRKFLCQGFLRGRAWPSAGRPYNLCHCLCAFLRGHEFFFFEKFNREEILWKDGPKKNLGIRT